VLSQQRFFYIQHLKSQAQYLQGLVAKEQRVLEQIREEMREAHVQKKSLERLEEKQRQAYERQLADKETKELEDLIIARNGRF